MCQFEFNRVESLVISVVWWFPFFVRLCLNRNFDVGDNFDILNIYLLCYNNSKNILLFSAEKVSPKKYAILRKASNFQIVCNIGRDVFGAFPRPIIIPTVSKTHWLFFSVFNKTPLIRTNCTTEIREYQLYL